MRPQTLSQLSLTASQVRHKGEQWGKQKRTLTLILYLLQQQVLSVQAVFLRGRYSVTYHGHTSVHKKMMWSRNAQKKMTEWQTCSGNQQNPEYRTSGYFKSSMSSCRDLQSHLLDGGDESFPSLTPLPASATSASSWPAALWRNISSSCGDHWHTSAVFP